jgi:hypothetical protein
MATQSVPEKKIDLPITDAPGSHPIETGIGALAAGAISGLAAGALAGPVGTAIGAAAGAVAGGYAGKGVGELIDPTTEDHWLRDHFKSRPYVEEGDSYEDFNTAFRYGALTEAKYGDAGINLMDQQLQKDWEADEANEMPWAKARGAVKDAYDRTVQIRRERELPEACDEVQEY